MRSFFLLFVLIFPFIFSCSKDDNSTPAPVDQRDKFLGTWEGQFYLEIPNIPPNSPLSNLPDSLATSLSISKSSENDAEILIVITNTLVGNRTVKAFVNGNRYYYEPFNANVGLINISYKGDGLLNNDAVNITEEGFLKTSAVSLLNIPSLIGVWSSKLKKKI